MPESPPVVGEAFARFMDAFPTRVVVRKGIDVSGYSQLQLNAIARQLNNRPRTTLGFHALAEMFSECVASTG